MMTVIISGLDFAVPVFNSILIVAAFVRCVSLLRCFDVWDIGVCG